MAKTCFVGVDVSKDKFNAHWLGEDAEFGNDSRGQSAFLKAIPENSVVAMEATGNYFYRLALRCGKRGFRVMVFNPLQVRKWIQSLPGGFSGENDRLAARRICAFSQRKEVAGQFWQPPGRDHARAKAIATLLAGLAKTRLLCVSRRHAAGLVLDGGDPALDSMSGVSEACGGYMDSLYAELIGIMKKLYPSEFELLVSINGVAGRTAAVLLARVGDMSSFPSGRHLAAFFGIAPVTKESGVSVRGAGHINKKGYSYIRALFYNCAGSALVHNRQMREFYQRLVGRGVVKDVARVAVARKLLVLSWHVVRSGEFWREDYSAA